MMKSSHYNNTKADHAILFSVIVPIYNSEKYLTICLDSIIDQTNQNYELLLVNDGSTDRSGEICMKYCNRFSRIKYIENQNSGVSAARNIGIDLAEGEYILFCDSDDYWDHRLLETIKPYVETGEYDLINFGHVVDLYEDEVLIGSLTRGVPTDVIIHEGEWKDKFRYYWNSDIGKLSSCEKAFRRRTVIENGLKYHQGQEILEDFEFVIQNWAKAKEIILIDKMLYHIRSILNGNGIMKRRQPNLIPAISYSMQLFEEFLGDEHILNEDFPEKDNFVFGSYMLALDRVKSGRASRETVIAVVKQLFSNKLFLDSSITNIGRRLKLLKIFNDLHLYSLVAWYMKYVY